MTLEEVHALALEVLSVRSVSGPQARAVADNLTAAERDECHSHGLFRLPGYLLAVESGNMIRDAVPEVSELQSVLDARAVPASVATKVHLVVAETNHRTVERRAPVPTVSTENCGHPQQQLAQMEWLRHVVVATLAEAANTIFRR